MIFCFGLSFGLYCYCLCVGVYVFLICDGVVLLIFQGGVEFEFQFFGGGIDLGELLQVVLYCEVYEEIGWIIGMFWWLGIYCWFCYMLDYGFWVEKLCLIWLVCFIWCIGLFIEFNYSVYWFFLVEVVYEFVDLGCWVFVVVYLCGC